MYIYYMQPKLLDLQVKHLDLGKSCFFFKMCINTFLIAHLFYLQLNIFNCSLKTFPLISFFFKLQFEKLSS